MHVWYNIFPPLCMKTILLCIHTKRFTNGNKDETVRLMVTGVVKWIDEISRMQVFGKHRKDSSITNHAISSRCYPDPVTN